MLVKGSWDLEGDWVQVIINASLQVGGNSTSLNSGNGLPSLQKAIIGSCCFG